MSVAQEIATLIVSNGKSAADMTHAIKTLGEGSMQDGLARVATYFSRESTMRAAKSLSKGRMQGIAMGAAGTVIVVGTIAWVAKLKRKQKDHDDEGKRILNAMGS